MNKSEKQADKWEKMSEPKQKKMSKEELNKILLNPDYSDSLGIKVYVRVEDNGDKYAVLNNGEEEIELKIKQR